MTATPDPRTPSGLHQGWARTDPADVPRDRAVDARIQRIDRLAGGLDGAFRIPLTPIRFGWDSILGLVPGIGDTLSLAPAAWIVKEAHSLGLPKAALIRMGANIGIDWIVGSIPLVGDIFDVGFKANRRNANLIRTHFGLPPLAPGGSSAKDASAA